jgi:hypothetical protein
MKRKREKVQEDKEKGKVKEEEEIQPKKKRTKLKKCDFPFCEEKVVYTKTNITCKTCSKIFCGSNDCGNTWKKCSGCNINLCYFCLTKFEHCNEVDIYSNLKMFCEGCVPKYLKKCSECLSFFCIDNMNNKTGCKNKSCATIKNCTTCDQKDLCLHCLEVHLIKCYVVTDNIISKKEFNMHKRSNDNSILQKRKKKRPNYCKCCEENIEDGVVECQKCSDVFCSEDCIDGCKCSDCEKIICSICIEKEEDEDYKSIQTCCICFEENEEAVPLDMYCNKCSKKKIIKCSWCQENYCKESHSSDYLEQCKKCKKYFCNLANLEEGKEDKITDKKIEETQNCLENHKYKYNSDSYCCKILKKKIKKQEPSKINNTNKHYYQLEKHYCNNCLKPFVIPEERKDNEFNINDIDDDDDENKENSCDNCDKIFCNKDCKGGNVCCGKFCSIELCKFCEFKKCMECFDPLTYCDCCSDVYLEKCSKCSSLFCKNGNHILMCSSCLKPFCNDCNQFHGH